MANYHMYKVMQDKILHLKKYLGITRRQPMQHIF